jgi:hypothetical protein
MTAHRNVIGLKYEAPVFPVSAIDCPGVRLEAFQRGLSRLAGKRLVVMTGPLFRLRR